MDGEGRVMDGEGRVMDGGRRMGGCWTWGVVDGGELVWRVVA